MAFTRTGTVSHDTLAGVSAADHHAATVAGDLDLADLNERLHGSLATVTSDQHHAQAHNLVTHAIRDHANLSNIDSADHRSAATQTQMEGETTTTTAVIPIRVRHSPGVAKAWCRITAAGALESPSYNVASVTDTATGDRIVVWDDDFSTVVYSIGHGLSANDTRITLAAFTFAVGSVVVTVHDQKIPGLKDLAHSVQAWGDQGA